MTSQLDEHSCQILTQEPEQTISPSRRRRRIVATAAVASLVLGAGLIVAVARTDGTDSPLGNAEQGDTPTPGTAGSDLPSHLQEFEARTAANPAEASEEPERSAYQMIQDEIDASLARRDSALDE